MARSDLQDYSGAYVGVGECRGWRFTLTRESIHPLNEIIQPGYTARARAWTLETDRGHREQQWPREWLAARLIKRTEP